MSGFLKISLAVSAGASAGRTLGKCGPSIGLGPSSEFARRCLANPYLRKPRTTSTRPKLFAAAGQCASWTGRSAASSTSVRYSESDLEDALIRHLADILLELGDDFAFVGRQRRLRLDDTWFRIDLLFFHRRLRCLLVIDLKVGKLTYADAGQMHLYLNYARAHWMKAGENPPVGLILCASKGAAEAHYALDGLPNKVLAAEYQTVLPDEKLLAEELARTRDALEARGAQERT